MVSLRVETTPNLAKIAFTASTLTLAALAALFVFIGEPVTRPIWFFVLWGLGYACLTIVAVFDAERHFLPLLSVTALYALLLRVSGYLNTISVGYDMGHWFGRTSDIVQTGYVTGGDMYTASPLYLLQLAEISMVLGISIPDVRLVTILISIGQPLLIGVLAHVLTHDRTTVAGATLAASPFPFFLRVPALVESEFMAIIWFIVVCILFIRCYRYPTVRILVLLLSFLSTGVMLHFFYGFVFWLIIAGTVGTWLLVEELSLSRFLSPPVRVRHTARMVMIPSFIILTWQLWSVYAHTSVMTLLSAITLGGSSVSDPALADSTGGVQFAPLKYLPLLIIGVIGGAGGLISLVKTRHRDTPAILLVSVLGGATVVLVAIGLDYDLGFRMFYFAGVGLVLFAGYTFKAVKPRPYSTVLLVIALFVFATAAPLTPLGNNTDPRFGGSSWALSYNDEKQLSSMSPPLPKDGPINREIGQVHGFFLPSSDEVLTTEKCTRRGKFISTGKYHLCVDDKRSVAK